MEKYNKYIILDVRTVNKGRDENYSCLWGDRCEKSI